MRGARRGAQALAACCLALIMGLVGCGQTTDERLAEVDGQAASSIDVSSASDTELVEEIVQVLPNPSEASLALKAQMTEAIGTERLTHVSVTYLRLDDPSDTFSINGATPHPSASMIKLVVLTALLEQCASGDLSLDDTLTIADSDIVYGSGVLQGCSGQTYTLRELAGYMISESDNIAANMLIDLLGMDAVNEKARELGLDGSSLQRKMMDTEAQEQGLENMMSSDDIAEILTLAATGKLVDQASSDFALQALHEQGIDAGLAAGTGYEVPVAHKTGELINAENDGGIIYTASPYVLVVMTDGVPNGEGIALITEISRLAYVDELNREGGLAQAADQPFEATEDVEQPYEMAEDADADMPSGEEEPAA